MTTPGRRIISVSVTDAGRALADRLPHEHLHGDAGPSVRERWRDADGFVLFLAIGAAVRIVAPLLEGKDTDPAVVCVDESGRYAVAVLGGHGGGANELAREVAGLLGAEPVVTTATDTAGVVALDTLPGLRAEGDVAGVTKALLAGERPVLQNHLGWPLPAALLDACVPGDAADVGEVVTETGRNGHVSVTNSVGPLEVVVTDKTDVTPPRQGTVVLRPPSLVAGIGTSTGTPPQQVEALLADALDGAGLSRSSVAEIATVDRRRDEPAITSLGLSIRCYTPEELAGVAVPNPSPVVDSAIGTASVAEAAALLAAGPGAELVVEKRKSQGATVAIARRARPRGRVTLVGLGPGGTEHRTPAAVQAVLRATVVIGYAPYVDQCADLLRPHHDVVRSPIGAEVERATTAVDRASGGDDVVVVCSGDAGVYAMASLVMEIATADRGIDMEVVPGVTAGLAAAAALGAPLGHDHVLISLSDLLTSWTAIRARIEAAAESDLVVVFYNPRSKGRDWQLGEAAAILAKHRPPDTPVGIVTDAARPGETVHLTTLRNLEPELVGMTSCVIVGATTTKVIAGRMVTPRGYETPEAR